MPQSTLGKAILIGSALAVAGATFSLIFPSVPNYAFLPGMMTFYIVSGGVHGYANGVYMPNLPAWYALGGLVNTFLYSVLAFAVLQLLHHRKNKDSL